MQVRDILYVVAVAETGGFSKAALRENVSQPALSQMIGRLEGELGVKLFSRENNKVTLTAAGEVFVEDGKEILRRSNELRNKMERFAVQKKGEFVIGTAPYYQRAYLNFLLPDFQKLYPDIRIRVVDAYTADMKKMLFDDVLEAIIICDPCYPELDKKLKENGCEFLEIFEEQLVLGFPPDSEMIKRLPDYEKGICMANDLALFKEESFVVSKRGSYLRNLIFTLCREAGFEPRLVMETNISESVNDMISRGAGIGLVQYSMRYLCHQDRIAEYIAIQDPRTIRHFGIVYKPDKIRKSAKLFIEHVKNNPNQELLRRMSGNKR